MAGTLKAQVEAFDVKVGVLIKNSDATGLSELFTEDCSMMPPGRDVVKGRHEVYAFWKAAFELGEYHSWEPTVDEVGPMGDCGTAYDRGHRTFFKKDGTVSDRGKYVRVFKQEEGEWLVHIDIFNSNAPPSA